MTVHSSAPRPTVTQEVLLKAGRPAVALSPVSKRLLPREPMPVHALAAIALVSGVAMAYCATISVPTSNAYVLRRVEREIAGERSRQEELLSRKATLEAMPNLLARGRRIGIDTAGVVDMVLEPRP